MLQAWNLEFQAEVALNGPVVGQVYAMEVGNSMFFAGTQVICLLTLSFFKTFILWYCAITAVCGVENNL